MKSLYRIITEADAQKKNTVLFEKLRLTLLTDRLLRIEWSESNDFTDSPTQKVFFRNFDEVAFTKKDSQDFSIIETEFLKVVYTKADNLRSALRIGIKGTHAEWSFGDKFETLKGTARTLDNADGAIELEEGIISREGFSVLDDSGSFCIAEDGFITARTDGNQKDLYFFGYGHDYRTCLADYLRLTGMPPLLPKYALGNWWSRYHKYTQKEYIQLVENFKKENIPLSVAMIDMDWHLVDIDKSIGTGWTGYTWNKEFFPKPEELLNWLHNQNLKVSLNIHPAEGVGRHEDAYEAFLKEMELENDGKSIAFDITNPRFMEAYFKHLHLPLEKQGVDFWWIDWQQGTTTAIPGVDPLWMLNHYHYLDNGKDGNRPLILSRYSGPGSHRYPVGFSGDSIISWDSLDFQPYFTSTASNIGYGWWSHDIGGHMLGCYDEELQVRWVQFGVFSPIMRLHCSASDFNHKEPWKYEATASGIIKEFMRLRHRLIPYLYTMNRLFANEGRPLVEPMYHGHPERDEAYNHKNEYYFGTELLVCPVTKKIDGRLQAASASVWLPEGKYTDIFTGFTYAGNAELSMYRSIHNIPVLLKAGGIVPMASDESFAEQNPTNMEIMVGCGADGKFTMYEDDGISLAYRNSEYAETDFVLESDENGSETVLEISSARGAKNIVPSRRNYVLKFYNCGFTDSAELHSENGVENITVDYDKEMRTATVSLSLSSEKSARVVLKNTGGFSQELAQSRCFTLLDKMNCGFLEKESVFQSVCGCRTSAELYRALLEKECDADLIKAVMERFEAR